MIRKIITESENRAHPTRKVGSLQNGVVFPGNLSHLGFMLNRLFGMAFSGRSDMCNVYRNWNFSQISQPFLECTKLYLK